MKDIKKIVAENLRAHRAIARLSQQEVADKIGKSVASVKAWEEGENAMSIEALYDLADLYGVSTDALMGRVPRSVA